MGIDSPIYLKGMVSTRVLRGSLVHLSKKVSTVEICLELGINPEAMDNPDGYVPQRVWKRALELAESRTGDPNAGLHAAETLDWGRFDVIDYIIGTSANLREAIEYFQRFFPVLNTATRFLIEEDEGDLWVERRMASDERKVMPRHAAEFSLACTTLRLGSVCQTAWKPAAMEFRYPAPQDIAPFQRIFGCPLRFEAPRDAFRVDKADFSRAMKAADPALMAIIARQAHQMIQALPQEHSLIGTLSELLGRELLGKPVQLEAIAHTLGMSERTLQRELQQQGTCFREVLDHVRISLAKSFLASTSMSVAEIAFALGYSEARAFQRAFRKHVGHPPNLFRGKAATASVR